MTRNWIDPARRGEVEIAPVYCAGCGRKLGVAPTYRRVFRVLFCDEFCWQRPPIPDMEIEERARLVRALSQYVGLTQHKLAEVFGISRSRVGQHVAPSNVDEDYLLVSRAEVTEETRETKARAGKAGGAKRWEASKE